jgi:hypothetical protein
VGTGGGMGSRGRREGLNPAPAPTRIIEASPVMLSLQRKQMLSVWQISDNRFSSVIFSSVFF